MNFVNVQKHKISCMNFLFPFDFDDRGDPKLGARYPDQGCVVKTRGKVWGSPRPIAVLRGVPGVGTVPKLRCTK